MFDGFEFSSSAQKKLLPERISKDKPTKRSLTECCRKRKWKDRKTGKFLQWKTFSIFHRHGIYQHFQDFLLLKLNSLSLQIQGESKQEHLIQTPNDSSAHHEALNHKLGTWDSVKFHKRIENSIFSSLFAYLPPSNFCISIRISRKSCSDSVFMLRTERVGGVDIIAILNRKHKILRVMDPKHVIKI